MQYQSQIIRLHTDHEYCKRLPANLCGDLLRLFKPLTISSVRDRRVPITRKMNAAQSWATLSSFFGAWPGHETDQEWDEMLLALKK